MTTPIEPTRDIQTGQEEVDTFIPVTDPRHPNHISPQLLTRKGLADILVKNKENALYEYPEQQRGANNLKASFVQFIAANDDISVSESSPTSFLLTKKVAVHAGPTSTKTTKKSTKIKGSKRADFMFGGVNSDKLVGGKGDDFLVGGIGKDILVGGPGDDFLWGGIGSDKFKDLRGNDTFVNFDLYGNGDVIVDQLEDVEIIGHGENEYHSTLISHKKGTLTIAGWYPNEVIESGYFNEYQ